MARSSGNRRRGVRLIIIGFVLVVASFVVLLLTLPSGRLGSPPTQSPVQTVDYIGIAALISSAGGFFAGVISAVTGLILALKRPGKAPESRGAGESDQPKV